MDRRDAGSVGRPGMRASLIAQCVALSIALVGQQQPSRAPKAVTGLSTLGSWLSHRAQRQETRANKDRIVTTSVTVILPHPDAELKVDGAPIAPTKKTGVVCVLELPAVGAGPTFKHEFDVKWKPNVFTVAYRKKSIEFRAGDRVTVDLTTATSTDRAEVIYVPTPQDVVTRMVQLGNVTKDDVVYELGCGDARILIATVKEGGASKGIGIDFDAARVRESIANVRSAGVADRIEIRHGDVFDDKVTAGLEDATLVMLYMSDELNLALRPKLLRTLKPGARVVSHRFLMGDWKPDRTEEITVSDGTRYKLHLWIVKALDRK